MKKIFALVSILTVVLSATAQQELQFSQVLSNPYFFNPAAGGLSNVGEVYLSQRTQWTSISGRPVSFYGTINSIIDTKKGDDQFALQELNKDRNSVYQSPERTLGKKHIVGGKMFTDQIGPFSKNAVQASYAYHLMVSPDWNLGAGLGLGWSNFGIDENKSVLTEAGDAAFLSYAANSPRQNYIDASAGLVFYSKELLVSLATTQLMNTTATFDGITSESKYNRHYTALLSYRINLNTSYTVEPLVIAKSVKNAPMSFDAGFRFHYKNMGFFSATYRNQNALSFGIGLNLLKNFRICYSYDLSIAKTRSFGAGSHEVQFGLIFGHKRNLNKEFEKDEKERKQKEIESQEDN